ncbi:MAG: SpoIIE family protein phosphatase [Spirochaetota bacterium]
MDYFLISQLLNPLQALQGNTKTLETNIFLEHKKKLNVRAKTMDIGGDYNFYQEIHILGRSFLFFTNADAMGKSLQGAGGAIVYGASLKSQLMRYQFNKNEINLPELWLREIFYDLQDIFASFDCNMLMSGIIGLVDLQNYICYYINAEHPYPVLWRDNKASFLPHKHILKKVGTPQAFLPEFSIEVVKLSENDTLILGSDGRDDILLTQALKKYLKENKVDLSQTDGTSAKSVESSLNDDEQLFLKIVEIANGDIKEVSNIIKTYSQTTDDLSLVSLKMNNPNKEGLPPIDESFLKEVSNLYRQNEYDSALKLLNSEFNKQPFDIFNVTLMNLLIKLYKKLNLVQQAEILEYLIYFLKPENERFLQARVEKNMKKKQWGIAADFIEVLRIRYPHNHYYSLLSAQIFYEKGVLEKARNLLVSVKESSGEQFLPEITALEELISEKEKISKKINNEEYSFWSKLFDHDLKK